MMFSKLIAYTLLTVAYVKAQTLYLAGDSTMAADDGNAAIIGWGTAVGKYINVPVVNKAVAGRNPTGCSPDKTWKAFETTENVVIRPSQTSQCDTAGAHS